MVDFRKRLREKLPCAFCEKKFTDFGPLGEHVRQAHPEIGAALPSAPETKPDKYDDAVNQLGPDMAEDADASWEQHGWFQGNEDENMLPPVGGGKTQSQRGGGDNRGSGRRPSTPPSVPFIKVEDLTQDPVTAKILGVQTQNTGFNDVIVKIAIRGRSFFFGLKASNPNYETLVKALGNDENAWMNAEFTIGLEFNEFYEKNFVNVFEVKPSDGTPVATKRGKKNG